MTSWLKDIKFFNSGGRNFLKLYLSLLDEELHKKIIENNLKYLG